MANSISIEVNLSPEQIIEAVRRMKKSERASFVEDLISAASPEYLESIREAREDYRKGRTSTHADVFPRK
ncbi:MAG: hypothetical protein V1799_10655 [bacterium]